MAFLFFSQLASQGLLTFKGLLSCFSSKRKHSAQPPTWRHDVFCLPPPSRTNRKQYPVGLKLIEAKNSLHHIIRAHKLPLHDTNQTVGEYLTMTGNNFCKVMYVPCNRLILRAVCLSSGPHMRHCCMEHTPPKATCK